ncbi:glycoside hydrolase family 3 protein [Actinomadura oligospora]|uniref:glycoside hydrolase family 3 protein n=1 Tax=Actinomadura oligospora TaxID=111804 RepID=UPI0004B0E9CB|nr:glycoside hydrolase family 3 protein [Actinomadura oligospora]
MRRTPTRRSSRTRTSASRSQARQQPRPQARPRIRRAAPITAALTAALLAATPLAAVTTTAHAATPARTSTTQGRDPHLMKLIDSMTLRQKVAQLFVVQVYGMSADTTNPADVASNRALYGVDNAAQLIARDQPGGIIYYGNNVTSPQQLAGFSNGIQRAARAAGHAIPSTIAIDQEGGIVARVGAPATQQPGAMALAAGRRAADARALARITGAELRAIGVDTDYAPDSDVNVNPANPVIGVRSFGSDPALVSRMVTAQLGGYRSANVTATAKHFPGHGDADTDSHVAVPIIRHTRAQWESIDLPPFRAAIAAGADSIMTGHLVVPALDPSGDPATLSRPIVTGILRDQLHYRGLVITDALDMQGVRDKYGDDRVPVLALKAGVDVLLKPPAGRFATQLDAVVNAVRNGELSEDRIDQSVYRVLDLKQRRGLFTDPYVDESRVGQVVGSPDHLAAARRATGRTTTLVKNDPQPGGATLPLAPGPRSVHVTGWGTTTTATLATEIGKYGATADAHDTGLSPTPAAIASAAAAARAHDLTVVVTNRAWDTKTDTGHNGPGQSDLVKALIATGKPVVVVAVRDAYDINAFPTAPAYLATFSYTADALHAAAATLFGANRPQGRLPVSIPVAGNPDQTLYPFGHGLDYPRK